MLSFSDFLFIFVFAFPHPFLRLPSSFSPVGNKMARVLNSFYEQRSMKERIRQIMEHEKMSQQEFAAKLEISPASLSSIFTGRTNPTNNHVQAIHRAFPSINVNWLMFGEGDMNVLHDESNGSDNSPTSGIEPPAPAAEGTLPMFDEASFQAPAPATGRTTSSPFQQRERTQQSKTSSRDYGTMKIIDRPTRKIKEIRVFFDDGTYEAFVPSK